MAALRSVENARWLDGFVIDVSNARLTALRRSKSSHRENCTMPNCPAAFLTPGVYPMETSLFLSLHVRYNTFATSLSVSLGRPTDQRIQKDEFNLSIWLSVRLLIQDRFTSFYYLLTTKWILLNYAPRSSFSRVLITSRRRCWLTLSFDWSVSWILYLVFRRPNDKRTIAVAVNSLNWKVPKWNINRSRRFYTEM